MLRDTVFATMFVKNCFERCHKLVMAIAGPNNKLGIGSYFTFLESVFVIAHEADFCCIVFSILRFIR